MTAKSAKIERLVQTRKRTRRSLPGKPRLRITRRAYVGLIKRSGDCYVALCPEINVASQGETIQEAQRMLQEACEEYLSYMREEGHLDEIQPISWQMLSEFLMEDVEVVRPSADLSYSETISCEIIADA